MITRIGKIAQLPKPIRDELNHRLKNGHQSPELLAWLNSLPETQDLIDTKFDRQPISPSNLSHWRHGGYEDWRADQLREARLQRISESGAPQEPSETSDLFENFARMTVAELALDLDTLPKRCGEKRSQKLHHLIRDLCRLQNVHDRTRRTALAWTEYNASLPPSVELTTHNSQLETPSVTSSVSTSVEPDCTKSQVDDSHDAKPEIQKKNFNPEILPLRTGRSRYVHTAPCGCVCRKCHPKDGPYPYWDAEHDLADKPLSSELVQRENGEIFTLYIWKCDCTCVRCDSKNRPEQPDKARKTIFRMIHDTNCNCGGICQKCHAPDSPYPLAELLRHQAHINEHGGDFIRTSDGISISFRYSFCNCSCDKCESAKLEQTENPIINITPSSAKSSILNTKCIMLNEPPRCPISNHTESHDKNPPPITSPTPQSQTPDPPSPLSPSIPPATITPLDDFHRVVALLKSAGQLHASESKTNFKPAAESPR
jgi:hypothetical protein